MGHTHAVIFTGGDPPHALASRGDDRATMVIAVDSGWQHAIEAGRTPSVLVGDMDSIRADHLADAESRGIEIVRHPAEKDLTDTEIALALATERGAESIHVVSGGGDRIDHILGFLHSVVAFALGGTRVSLSIGRARVDVATRATPVVAAVGVDPLVSLVPLGGPATGVSTEGLKWSLENASLEAFASRGVSNVAIGEEFAVRVATGAIAVIQPFFLPTGDRPAPQPLGSGDQW